MIFIEIFLRKAFRYKIHSVQNGNAASAVEEIIPHWFYFIIKRIAPKVVSGQSWTVIIKVMQFVKVSENQQYSYQRILKTKSVWITFV